MFNIDDMQNTGEFNINIDYRIEAFTEKEITNIYDRLMHITQQILDSYTKKNEDIVFKDIEIVTEKEKEIILKDFNDTEKEYPKDMLVFENLEKNAKKNPSKPAALAKENAVCSRLPERRFFGSFLLLLRFCALETTRERRTKAI